MSGEELIAAAARVRAAQIAVNANVVDYMSITTSNDEDGRRKAREKDQEYVAELQMAECDFAIIQMRWWSFIHEENLKNQQEWREHRAEAMRVNIRQIEQNDEIIELLGQLVEGLV